MHTEIGRLRSLIKLGSGSRRHRVGAYRAGAARRGGAVGARHALETIQWALPIILALSTNLVHAESPTCAAWPPAPACNPVTSDQNRNTAVGSGSLANTGEGDRPPNGTFDNTAVGQNALVSNTSGNSNTAVGSSALGSNTYGGNNTAGGIGALQSNTLGSDNTASGAEALLDNTTGYENTASGSSALYENTIGAKNTAAGFEALRENTTGNDNTASGVSALWSNTTGSNNVAVGLAALFSNTAANGNTAVGFQALLSNTTAGNNSALGNGALQGNVLGQENTAAGAESLFSNTSGGANSAYGFQALFSNTTASDNTASGFRALYKTTTGLNNTATGFAALLNNTTGNGNTAVGSNALNTNTIGLNNIAIGTNAGYLVTGSNNIDVGSTGTAGESGVIRIGGPSQTAAYMAGISSTHLTGAPVYVDSSGKLGVLASSERYKTQIAPMGGATQKLQELQPVSFHLKSDPKGIVQYGLIAEQVDAVFPELVIRDAAGMIQGVRYDELAPMLLNEVQQQQRELDQQRRELDQQRRELDQQQVAVRTLTDQSAVQAAKISDLTQKLAGLNDLKQAMRAVLAKLQSKDARLAQR